MSDALHRYKDLVDKLRKLSPSDAESLVIKIDEELKEAWLALGEVERAEAEAYWRSSTATKVVRPKDLN